MSIFIRSTCSALALSFAMLACSKSTTADGSGAASAGPAASTVPSTIASAIATPPPPSAGGGDVDASVTTRTVPAFSEIAISESLEADIDIGATTPLRITGDDAIVAMVVTKVENGVLTIMLPHGVHHMQKPLVVRGSTPSLTKVEAASSGLVLVRGLAADKLAVDTSSSGAVVLHGTCKALDVTASSGSKIDAKDLRADAVKVDTSSGANVSVSATSSLTGRASTGSRIRLSGNPAENKVETSTGARVD